MKIIQVTGHLYTAAQQGNSFLATACKFWFAPLTTSLLTVALAHRSTLLPLERQCFQRYTPVQSDLRFNSTVTLTFCKFRLAQTYIMVAAPAIRCARVVSRAHLASSIVCFPRVRYTVTLVSRTNDITFQLLHQNDSRPLRGSTCEIRTCVVLNE